MINLVVRELVNDGTITRQQEATADNPEEKYKAIEDLDEICKDFKIVDYHFSFKQTEGKIK